MKFDPKDKTLIITGHTKSNMFERNGGGFDIFAMKINLKGKVIWGIQFGSERFGNEVGYNDYSHHIEIDKSGNIYIGGYTHSQFKKDMPTKNGSNILFIKLSPEGKVLWTKVIGGDGQDEMFSFKLDSNENIVFAVIQRAI